MSSVTQTVYLTKMIREGFEKADVDMWQALCQQCKTDIGKSHEHMFLLLDMARHNDCSVLDIVKTGRVCSEQRSINDKFIDAVLNSVASDDEGVAGTKVLDLTAEEELSGSYEETDDKYIDAPTSNEAYEIDGFVVEDHDSDADVSDKKQGVKRKLKQTALHSDEE